MLHLGSTGEIVAREKTEETVEENYDVVGENIKNPWAENGGDSNPSIEIFKPVPLRRRASPKVRTGSPLVRTGSPLVRTGSPLVRTGSPLVRTESPGGDVGKKARLSIISIASNISSKFRRSVDLSEEEAKLVVAMSTAAVIDDEDEEGLCV